MSTIFTRIIEGELPGRFVWRDDRAVAFLSIQPLAEGHVLVVPVEEYDHWTDLPQELAEHLMAVSQKVGQAIREAYQPRRVGLMIQGFEVPHTHLHVWPADSVQEFSFANVDQDPSEESMDRAQEKIRAALEAAGHREAQQ